MIPAMSTAMQIIIAGGSGLGWRIGKWIFAADLIEIRLAIFASERYNVYATMKLRACFTHR